LLVRDALFLPPRFGNETVPEVFPDGAVLFQVNENTHLAAFLIGDELNTAHILIILEALTARGHQFVVLYYRVSPNGVDAMCETKRWMAMSTEHDTKSNEFELIVQKWFAKKEERRQSGWEQRYVHEVLPKTMAPRKILVVAGTSQSPPVGSLLFLPPETQERNSQNP
jgi:hypothetical protein